MAEDEPDIKADIKAALDRGESIALMEPMRRSELAPHIAALNDLAVELAAQSAGLRRSLPPEITTALADLVRAMNCYYSNLIEGHDTHPIDRERALKTTTAPIQKNATCSSRLRLISRSSPG